MAERPRIGLYSGVALDVSCPGDNITFEILLDEYDQATIERIPELSIANGGLPPWKVEGTWEWDDDEEKVYVVITKKDAIGPQLDTEEKIAVSEDGSLTYQRTKLEWKEAAPDKAEVKMRSMSMAELKAAAADMGFDPAGCIERADIETVLRRAGGVKVAPPVMPAKVTSPSVAADPVGEPVAPAAAGDASADAGKPTVEAAAVAAAAVVVEEGCYTLEQLTDKRTWEKLEGLKTTDRETYLPETVFVELFKMSKAEFAKVPKWKRDGEKKKHGLF